MIKQEKQHSNITGAASILKSHPAGLAKIPSRVVQQTF